MATSAGDRSDGGTSRARSPRTFPLAFALLALLASPPTLLAAPSSAPAVPTAASPGTVIRRFALIASANHGGAGRPTLRFADSDARAVADVLAHLGGLREGDLVLLPAASRSSLRAGFASMKDAIEKAPARGVRRELFVYYSGHSDEDGLLLGGERMPYKELRALIEAAGADVRIAILDSCASGALIRGKGGSRRPPFLSDVSTEARGHAFLTASSADEAAQESERIGAAFFTHYFLSGLRGAADTSRDGRVTLSEAYQFAYQETLHRTEQTVAGPQHAAYDIQLAGTGDLVMTDLRATSAGLVIADEIAGRLYVRDASGRLLVELRKEPTYPVELGLGPGAYRVVLDADGRPFEARVTLSEGRSTRLGRDAFLPADRLAAVPRGDDPARPAQPSSDPEESLQATAPGAGAPSTRYRHVRFDVVLAPGFRASGGSEPVLHNLALGIITHSHALRGLQLGLAGNIVEDDFEGLQLSSGFNLSRGTGRGLQIASGANLSLGPLRGLQIAGGVNEVASDLRGLQLGPVNITTGGVDGAQIGVANYAGGAAGYAQIGVLNVARASFKGAQIGVANLSGERRGPQIGVLNVGGSADGVQIGVVNIASKMRGLQLGVVNVGGAVDGASIGLVNAIVDGYHAAHVWTSDLAPSNVGFKLGNRHLYTLTGIGLGRTDDDRALLTAQLGLGAHILPAGERLFLDVDAVLATYGTSVEWEVEDRRIVSLRVVAGWQLFRYLALTAGPTLGLQMAPPTETHRPGLGGKEVFLRRGDHELRLYPGFVLGLQI